jgi:hypothetical protein
MPIHYNLYRFGVDEFAVGHLINGDFPADDEERWRVVDAPHYHIERLLHEHLRAQEALRSCQDTGKPFVLFLRSFASEQKGERVQNEVVSQVSMHSIGFQDWLKGQLAGLDIPLVKLHGGSDGFYTGQDKQSNILSTHAYNWQPVAEELLNAASAIVFLVSHLTPGVADEFAMIRKLQRMDRTLVLRLDAGATPGPVSGDAPVWEEHLRDFPHVFPLSYQGSITYPDELMPHLRLLLQDAKTTAPIEHSLNAIFTYLEPGFTESEDYDVTERTIWKGLRMLSVVFEDKYWAALKMHGIPFQHFKFPQHWIIAHQLYGLAIATADFKAIRESLRYLSLLYIFRGADLALLVGPLADKYDQLAKQIFVHGEPDLEEKYAPGKDVLTLSNRINVAISLFEYAQRAEKEKDLETAMYLYQAAVISALKAEDTDEINRTWVLANMCRDWAIFQANANQPLWAITNSAFAVKLCRDLVAADKEKYLPSLAMCLNNLGSHQFKLQYFAGAEPAFEEALTIRRSLPPGAEDNLVAVYNSLANLALLKIELGKHAPAGELLDEALVLCRQVVQRNPARMADLTRLQSWSDQFNRK